jgi:hypothetical protein
MTNEAAGRYVLAAAVSSAAEPTSVERPTLPRRCVRAIRHHLQAATLSSRLRETELLDLLAAT